MQRMVGRTEVELEFSGGETPLIQNLGPGRVYWDRQSGVTTGTGILIDVGLAFEFPSDLGSSGGATIFLVSDTDDTDIRYVVVN